MKNIIPSLLLAGVVSFTASSALADDAKSDFKAMDANGDGKVTSDEHSAFTAAMFAQCDSNHDGRVSAMEWNDAAAAAKPSEKMDAAQTEAQLRMMDVDGDGQVSSAESAQFATKLFAQSDKDSDGVLTEKEYKSASKALKKDLKASAKH